MKHLVQFEVMGADVVPWSVPQVGRGRRAYRTKKTRAHLGRLSLEDWQALVNAAAMRAAAAAHVDLPTSGPVLLSLVFYAETPPGKRHGQLWAPTVELNRAGKWSKRGRNASDATNMLKGTEDALEGVLFRNDVQTRSVHVLTLHGPRPGVKITLAAIEDGDFPGSGDPVPPEITPGKPPRCRASKGSTQPPV